ncbi:MAG: glycosyltransferase family 2 protein [Chitinophagaceae bacterium]|nr:MAG: glycosyltransferase family 2 protein [Chitinophagaceae bacterium]
MKVSGCTFVKNAEKYGYPVVESIQSILPLVDEMIVCVGDSDDATNEMIENIGSSKIKLVHSVWDKNLTKDGKVLAVETNKALDAVDAKSDWLFYIQADEVVHEKYHVAIKDAMEKYLGNKKVEGLLFRYRHFFGSYKFIGDGRKWYSKEIRIIRNDKNIRSYRDAQGFRWSDNRKLNVKLIDAYIFHYGWVKHPLTMFKKWAAIGKLWSDDNREERTSGKEYDYSGVDSVSLYKDTHPAVMQSLVESEDWVTDVDVNKKNFKNFKHRFLYFIEQKFGWKPFEYSNYKRI